MSDDFSKKYQIAERPYLLYEHNRLNLGYTDVLATLHNILYPNETLIVEWKKMFQFSMPSSYETDGKQFSLTRGLQLEPILPHSNRSRENISFLGLHRSTIHFVHSLLQWRDLECYGASNQMRVDCLFNSLFSIMTVTRLHIFIIFFTSSIIVIIVMSHEC